MVLSAYGIKLERLSSNDIELVRYWRNLDRVRFNMKFQDIITAEMQSNWFSNLDNVCNYYFIIKENDSKIGVVNLKDIDWNKKEAEAGIFIGDDQYLNTLTPILATISLMEFAFENLKLNSLRAKISSSNVKAILFNESIGYVKNHLQDDNDFHYYSTDENLFKSATKNIRTTLDKLR